MAATGPSNSPQSAATAAATELPTKSASEDSTQPEQAQKSDDMTQTNNNSNNNNATASHAPNYFSTKTSKAYTLAYKLLNSDNFQDALSTLETALQFTVQILGTQEGNEEVELHESLAPLYYLYGSTLLYSVEESDVMMASSAPPTAAPDLQVGDDDDENPEMMSKNNPPPPSQAGGEEQPSSSDPTEDLQIAWENLETARSIVTKMVETFHPLGEIMGGKSEYNPTSATTTSYTTPKEQSDLLLDLAQIHTRLGDLQRGNNSVANTSDCIADYSTALKLRTQVLGRYDKKVADSHYSLAGVCAEAPSQNGGEVEEAVDRFVSQMGGGSGGGGGGSGGKEMTESEKMDYRERSLEHYVQCAVSFSGLLAKMCGEDADAFTSLSGTAAAASASASSSEAESGVHSSMLSTLRSRVSNLTPPTKSPEKESFEDIAEILDEIQEAVDTAEEAEEGLRTLGAMKANEIRKHEAKMNGEQGCGEMEEEGGGMTTIGFGASAAASTAAASGTINVFGAASAPSSTSANAFGSATVAASATAAKPMMVVKKKKKVQPVLIDASSTKRAKTE